MFYFTVEKPEEGRNALRWAYSCRAHRWLRTPGRSDQSVRYAMDLYWWCLPFWYVSQVRSIHVSCKFEHDGYNVLFKFSFDLYTCYEVHGKNEFFRMSIGEAYCGNQLCLDIQFSTKTWTRVEGFVSTARFTLTLSPSWNTERRN